MIHMALRTHLFSILIVITVAAAAPAVAAKPAVAATPAPAQTPLTWTWPSSASDPQVRQSIVDGHYTQEELRNIRSQLEALSIPPLIDAAHPADAPILIGPPPSVKFSGRGFRGLESFFGGQGYLYGSIPDRVNVVQSILAKGDRVWVVWQIKGHQSGAMFGFPASGKAIAVREMAMIRYKDGAMTEADYWGDDLGLYKELGGHLTFPGK